MKYRGDISKRENGKSRWICWLLFLCPLFPLATLSFLLVPRVSVSYKPSVWLCHLQPAQLNQGGVVLEESSQGFKALLQPGQAGKLYCLDSRLGRDTGILPSSFPLVRTLYALAHILFQAVRATTALLLTPCDQP